MTKAEQRDAEERRYHLAMAAFVLERGYVNLAQSFALAARDCPPKCECESCSDIREEREEERRRKAQARASRGPRVAA